MRGSPRRIVRLRALVLAVVAAGCSGSGASSQPPPVTAVTGPSDFFFIVDGPLVTNGPPWECRTPGTGCEGSPDGNLLGVIELVDGCIVVRSSDGPGLHVVIFPFGVSWDDTTSTIVGLGSEPIHVGDTVDRLANASQVLDDWLDQYGLPDAPDRLRECMAVADTDYVDWNAPWSPPTG